MKFLASLILTLLIFGFVPAVTAQTGAAYTDGKSSQLSAVQINNLKRLKTAVAVPTYITKGYKLNKFEIEKPDSPGVVFYNIIYSNAKGKTILFQSGNDGLGDIGYENPIKGNNPYFDELLEAGIGEDKRVIIGWISSKQKYNPKGVRNSQSFSLIADPGSITRQEAVKIMNSLRYLK